VDAVLRSICDGLAQDGVVRLAHFGTFKVEERAPRRLLLPGTQQELVLPQRKTVTFKEL
jgi:nucleoid DNA-binding protein